MKKKKQDNGRLIVELMLHRHWLQYRRDDLIVVASKLTTKIEQIQEQIDRLKSEDEANQKP